LKGSRENDDLLRGTTLRVYRYLYRVGKPVGLQDVKKALGLSSPSISDYHIKKLMQAGLVRSTPYGYVVDKMAFEDLIRIRKTLVPVQAMYAAFFAGMLVMLVAFFWSNQPLTLRFIIALVTIAVALGITSYEAGRKFRQVNPDW
jgi:uncharacterized membrane protein